MSAEGLGWGKYAQQKYFHTENNMYKDPVVEETLAHRNIKRKGNIFGAMNEVV